MSEEEIKGLQEHTDIIINEGLDSEDDIQGILKKWEELYNKEKAKNIKALDFINDENNYFEDGENWQNVLKIKHLLEEDNK